MYYLRVAEEREGRREERGCSKPMDSTDLTLSSLFSPLSSLLP
jgi:hypothetical protein